MTSDQAPREARSKAGWESPRQRPAETRPLVVRLYARRLGGHVHVAVFAGFNPISPGKCGDLVFREEEWPALRALLPSSIEIRWPEEGTHGG